MPTLVVGRMFLFEHYIEEKINQSLADPEVKQLFHLVLIDLLDKNGEIVRLKNVLLMVTQRMMTLEQKLDDHMSFSLQLECKPPIVLKRETSTEEEIACSESPAARLRKPMKGKNSRKINKKSLAELGFQMADVTDSEEENYATYIKGAVLQLRLLEKLDLAEDLNGLGLHVPIPDIGGDD